MPSLRVTKPKSQRSSQACLQTEMGTPGGGVSGLCAEQDSISEMFSMDTLAGTRYLPLKK